MLKVNLETSKTSRVDVDDLWRRDTSQLKKACLDFEAVLLGKLWTEATKSTGLSLGAWDTLAVDALSRSLSRSGGLGVEKMMYNSIVNKRKLEEVPNAADVRGRS